MVVGGEGESLPLFPENRFNTLIPNTAEKLCVTATMGRGYRAR